MNKAVLSSKSNEHYTPGKLLETILEFYEGEIDLDPCSNSLLKPNVPAHFHYDSKLNGLTLPWAGKVFVNPPYGRAIPTWVNKTILEYESLRAREILLLLPNRPGTQWYLSLSPYSRVNITGRLNFLDQNGKEQESAPFPSVLFYFGSKQQTFVTHWEKWGEVIIKKKPKFDKKEYQREYMKLRRQELKKFKSKDI